MLGIYGFMGCGQIELARTLFGKLRPSAGTLSIDGRPLRLAQHRRRRARAGIAFVPESRRTMLFHHEPVYKNVSIAILDRISRLWLRPAAEREIAQRHVERLRSGRRRVETLLGTLSGGNQQKVALAKWLT